MKHLKSFIELSESTSAGSFARVDVVPFKYSQTYDYRVGYSNMNFIQDLKILFKDLKRENRENLVAIISKSTGSTSLDSIQNLAPKMLGILIEEVQFFLDSTANFELKMYPDGYVLCFDDVNGRDGKFDIYYSPSKKKIKLVLQTGEAAEPEILMDIEEFFPDRYNISDVDFQSTIKNCDKFIKRKIPDTYQQ